MSDNREEKIEERIGKAENPDEIFVNDSLPSEFEIIGVTFEGSGKVYYFAANGIKAQEGKYVIVETARGKEYGKVTISNSIVPRSSVVMPLKDVVRIATDEDKAHYEANKEKEILKDWKATEEVRRNHTMLEKTVAESEKQSHRREQLKKEHAILLHNSRAIGEKIQEKRDEQQQLQQRLDNAQKDIPMYENAGTLIAQMQELLRKIKEEKRTNLWILNNAQQSPKKSGFVFL